MADDGKRSENVCVRVTERMLLDLNRIAALEERTQADVMFRLLRQFLYGNAARTVESAQHSSADKVIIE